MEINLAGQWQFRIDRERQGVAEKWFLQEFADRVAIPGSMEESGYGDIPSEVNIKDLNHTRFYRGWAWYKTEFELSAEDAAQHIELFLARIQWDSYVWVDGKYIGTRNSLATAHRYELTGLSAGRHQLVVLIDNSNQNTDAQLPEAGDDDETDSQGRRLSLHLHTGGDGTKKIACGLHLDHYAFNGIVGEAKLIVKPGLRIAHTGIYPDIHKKTVLVKVRIANECGCTGAAGLAAACEHAQGEASFVLSGEAEQTVCAELAFAGEMRLWDEYDPFVYTFDIKLTAGGEQVDTDRVSCGLRELRSEGQHIFLNDSRLYFRATLEGTAFPYTAYTPMDEGFWMRAFRILKSYGLNGMRMHSFVPPRAAFEAAEKIGFYFQIELPGTSCPGKDEDTAVTEFLWNELKQTLEDYGNYACFLFMSMGNEQLVASDKEFLARHQKLLMDKVAYGQETDPRHMYTCASHPHTDGRNDDFYLVATKDEIVMNGIRWGGPDPITTSRFCLLKPSTAVDFQEGVKRMDKPVMTHEVGQWAVYPNFAEMHKYTGVLKPRNYEVFAAQLDKNGLLHQNKDFVENSGQLSLLLYKEEIESALRTPDLSGFELLDIHDYPGQGTSTVGILDCFFDSKGLITPEEFRRFCAPVVPLCSFDRYVYTSGESMCVTPMVANYSRDAVCANGRLTVKTSDGAILYSAELDVCAPAGQLTSLAAHSIPLTCANATAATLTFEAAEAGLINTWDLWIYPAQLPEAGKAPVVVTELDERTEQLLAEGADVLYILPFGKPIENGCKGSFTSQFWNPFMKPQQTNNGIMCDPAHPIFRDFPTDSHTNFQWWEILMQSWSMYMDKLPRDFFPIVQVIPGIKDNCKIGLIWECRAEKGRLLICTADLTDCEGRPAAKQLLHSIRNYMSSDAFAPEKTLPIQLLREVLK